MVFSDVFFIFMRKDLTLIKLALKRKFPKIYHRTTEVFRI